MAGKRQLRASQIVRSTGQKILVCRYTSKQIVFVRVIQAALRNDDGIRSASVRFELIRIRGWHSDAR